MPGLRWIVAGLSGILTGCILGAQPAAVPPVTPVASPAIAGKPAEKSEVPRVFYTGRGQFEIIAVESAAAQATLELATNVWSALAPLTELPAEGFSSAVAVRLVPAEQWKETMLFTTVMEPGGLVNVRIRWSAGMDSLVVRRALVQALLLRRAVAWHGTNEQVTVPLWLEQACTAWSLTKERPAMLDAMQQESARLAPPPLESLLGWQRGAVESRGWELASFWLLLHLQAESGNERHWEAWLQAILGGADGVRALQRTYGGLWRDEATRELWWQAGFYHQRNLHLLPMLTAEESRAWLADRSRWLAVQAGRERVLTPDGLWNARQEPWVQAELKERTRQLQTKLAVIHPFYRNAVISMGQMNEAALKGKAADFKNATDALARDAEDGRELEEATAAALDAMGSGR
jgi:hypothetical protein